MAGGKETPRQKMIGMMYLVLTALLALNVSKEIIRAFVTINDKLDASGLVVEQTANGTYDVLQAKRSTLVAQKSSTEMVDYWIERSNELKRKTRQLVHFILSESNEMIKEAESGVDWVARVGEDDGLIEELKPLLDISAMDNYDIPTNRFIGGNPKQPRHIKGYSLRDSMHTYRDKIASIMATYPVGDKEYTFEAPETIDGLSEALLTANPEDTSVIAAFYKSMTLPETIDVREAGQIKTLPWASVMFDHAPIVAAAAMMTALKVDIINAEKIAIDHIVSKVDVVPFTFNKIEPMPFAATGYINQGDTLGLKVMIAAYDSTEVNKIRYGINEDTVPDKWTETVGDITLPGDRPGEFRVKGQIGVREKGVIRWKDWNFKYTVGKPSGTVSLPEMRVLYRGYNNVVEGAASGFPDYRLSASSNIRLTKQGAQWIAVPTGGNTAKISISGVAADGSTASLGGFDFDVRPLPPPQILFGGAANGQKASRAETRLFARYPDAITLKATFQITRWELEFMGRTVQGNGNQLNGQAQALLKQAQPNANATFLVDYRGPDGKISKGAVTVKM